MASLLFMKGAGRIHCVNVVSRRGQGSALGAIVGLLIYLASK